MRATDQQLRVIRDGLVRALRNGAFRRTYRSEDDFEADVWKVLWKWAARRWRGREDRVLLTSHTSREKPPTPRSPTAWKDFKAEPRGPDVFALGSNNRVDIVVRPPGRRGTIGVEVEWFSKAARRNKRSAPVLVHGLGQVALALSHRDLTVLVICCGATSRREVKELRPHAERFCRGSRVKVVVVG